MSIATEANTAPRTYENGDCFRIDTLNLTMVDLEPDEASEFIEATLSHSSLCEALEDNWRVHRTLGSEERIKIFQLVLERGSCRPSDLKEVLPISLSGIGRYLVDLRDAGVLTREKQGKSLIYSLNPDFVSQQEEFVRLLRNYLNLQEQDGG